MMFTVANRSRFVLLATLALLTAPVVAPAQECPPLGTLLFPGSGGGELQQSLVQTYRPPVGLSYSGARDVLYSEVDNHDGTVTCIYTGFTVAVNPGSSNPRGDAFAAGINAEHTWPQSKGSRDLPARADLHHLFPSEIQANNARASFPFDEIDDAETDTWYRLREVTANPDPETIDEYSELDRAFPGTSYDGRWEPREDRRGDVARAMFYFYTMYRTEAEREDRGYFDVQKAELRQWHLDDPVDAREYERTCAIAPHQDGKVNPFVIDPTLVDRAYFGGVPVRMVAFEAAADGDAVRLEWTTGSEIGHAGFEVARSANGAETTLTRTLLTARPPYGFTDRSGIPGTLYAYWIDAVARDGSRERFGPREIRYPHPSLAASVRPNPVRAGVAVRFGIEGGRSSTIELFDLSGRRIRSWSVEGESGVTWDGRMETGGPAVAGLYFVRFRSGVRVRTERLILIR